MIINGIKKIFFLFILLIGSINPLINASYVPSLPKSFSFKRPTFKKPDIKQLGLQLKSGLRTKKGRAVAGIAATLALIALGDKAIQATNAYKSLEDWTFFNDNIEEFEEIEKPKELLSAKSRFGKWLEQYIYERINFDALKKMGWQFDPEQELYQYYESEFKNFIKPFRSSEQNRIAQFFLGEKKSYYRHRFTKKNEYRVPLHMRLSQINFSLDDTNVFLQDFLKTDPKYNIATFKTEKDNFNVLARKIAYILSAYRKNRAQFEFLKSIATSADDNTSFIQYCTLVKPYSNPIEDYLNLDLEMNGRTGYNFLCRMYSALARDMKKSNADELYNDQTKTLKDIYKKKYTSQFSFKWRVYKGLLGFK